jgi:hypothetical protein
VRLNFLSAIRYPFKGDDRSGPGIGYYIRTIVLDIVLGFAAAMVVALSALAWIRQAMTRLQLEINETKKSVK